MGTPQGRHHWVVGALLKFSIRDFNSDSAASSGKMSGFLNSGGISGIFSSSVSLSGGDVLNLIKPSTMLVTSLSTWSIAASFLRVLSTASSAVSYTHLTLPTNREV